MSSQEPDNSGLPSSEESAEPLESAASGGRPGEQLLAERRAQGLSLGDVARQLKLSVRQVEALERDDYAAFPGPVFVRGFLRNYAKLLQLDPEALVAQAAIAAAPSAAAASPSVLPTPVPLQESGGGRRSRFGFGTLALGLVVIIVVLAAIYDARNKPAPVSLGPVAAVPSGQAHAPQHADSPPPSAPGTSVAAAPTPAVPATGANPADATVTPETATPPAPAVPAAPAAPAPAAAPAAAVAPPPAPGIVEVKLNFDAESWVEIKDGTGTVIFSRLNPAGAEQVVSGTAPLDVVIGNARSVRLTYRDKPVDLVPHTRVDVARVRLD